MKKAGPQGSASPQYVGGGFVNRIWIGIAKGLAYLVGEIHSERTQRAEKYFCGGVETSNAGVVGLFREKPTCNGGILV